MDRSHLRALAIFAVLGCAAGCGRSLQNRDAQGAPGHIGQDGESDRADGGPSGDVAVDVAGADIAVDVSADLAADVAPEVRVDRPDSGAADMNQVPDLGSPEAGPDAAPEVGPEAGPDSASDLGQPDAGQDAVSDRPAPDAGDTASDRDPSCGSPWDISHCGTCDHDCTKLPHVNTSIESLSCQAGVCSAAICELGYAHCSGATTGDRGCETDLWSDVMNCGGCGVTCGQASGSPGVCHKGACVGECPAGRGDCTDDFGCETHLTTPDHCGACKQPACAWANVVAPCRQPGSSTCGDGICAPGYGNCERTNPDCEAAYGSAAATCLPAYKGTRWLPTGLDGLVAVRADGARFIAGSFNDSIDFDFTAASDSRRADGDSSPYVTMVNADGGYGWTRTFRTTGAVTALTATGDGGVIIAGSFQGSIILNPDGSGGSVSDPQSSAFVVKLASSGAYVWGFIMPTSTFPAAITFQSLAVSPDGSIYAAGAFSGGVDFDPGPASAVRQGSGFGGAPFLLKLTKDRGFVWVDTWEVDDAKCVFYPGRIAASPVGVWTSGNFGGSCDFDPGSGVDLKEIGPGTGGTGYVLAVDVTGRYVGTWTFGKWVSDVVADGQGAVYAAGEYAGVVDFDPGPGDESRAATDGSSSFVVKLSAGGAFQWVTTPTRFSARAITLGRNGSVLVAGMLGQDGVDGGGVVELFPDQSLGWTVGFGSPNMRIASLASTASGFFVGGSAYWTTDMDPGPGNDSVPGGTPSGNPFVSEYGF